MKPELPPLSSESQPSAPTSEPSISHPLQMSSPTAEGAPQPTTSSASASETHAQRQDAISSTAQASPAPRLMLPSSSSGQLVGAPPVTDGGEANEAVRVRRHLMRGVWQSFTHLGRGRKWVVCMRFVIALAQIAVGITVLSLPSSRGSSPTSEGTCDPSGMFIFLILHTARVAASVPVDIYLGLSPHRTPAARREGAEGQARRERERVIGNLALDKRLSRIADLLGFVHVIIFIVGNWTTWNAAECAQSEAKSQPLWFGCVFALSITYIIIIEVAVLLFLVIFFLPIVILILRALGLGDRLPTAGIHPETGKIAQVDVDKRIPLVYYAPMDEPAGAPQPHQGDSHGGGPTRRSSLDQLEEATASGEARAAPSMASSTDNVAGAMVPLPLSRTSTVAPGSTGPRPSFSSSSSAPLTPVAASSSNPAGGGGPQPSASGPPSPTTSRKKGPRFSKLLGKTRKADAARDKASAAAAMASGAGESSSMGAAAAAGEGEGSDERGMQRLQYPLHLLPAHRATCPICLCDFETPPAVLAPGEEDPEPLRLMSCSHCMHKSCLDEWLTTMSGRCPVCQKPVLGDDSEEEEGQQQRSGTSNVDGAPSAAAAAAGHAA